MSMIKYYWFISRTIDGPLSESEMMYALDNYIKRSVTPPGHDYYYITEKIDGYNHYITDDKGYVYQTNDNGDPQIIKNIGSTIINKLKLQWKYDQHVKNEQERKEYLEKLSKLEKENEEKREKYFSSNPIEGLIDSVLVSRKRKPLKRNLMRVIKPCKCKPQIKKSIKKSIKRKH